MNITRNPELVESFHYDLNNPENELETNISVEIVPLDMTEREDFPHDTSCVLGLRVVYQIVYEAFVLTGAVRQPVIVNDRIITEPSELTQEEVSELMQPLFSIIKRMTYEVTEIALDQPGVELNFSSTAEPMQEETEA